MGLVFIYFNTIISVTRKSNISCQKQTSHCNKTMYKSLKNTYANAEMLCSKLLKQIQEVLKYHVSGRENTCV